MEKRIMMCDVCGADITGKPASEYMHGGIATPLIHSNENANNYRWEFRNNNTIIHVCGKCSTEENRTRINNAFYDTLSNLFVTMKSRDEE